MVSFKGHFDGKVIVPEEPVNLPINQTVRISIEELASPSPPPDFQQWLELGKSGIDNANRQFISDDDLWETKKPVSAVLEPTTKPGQAADLPTNPRPTGLSAGKFLVPDDFDAPLSDEVMGTFE